MPSKPGLVEIGARYPDPARGVPAFIAVIAPATAEPGSERIAYIRRDRRPSGDILVGIVTESHPRRCPFSAGHPYPADLFIKTPAAIMVGCPAPWIIAHPQAIFSPLAVDIRSPILRHIRSEGSAELAVHPLAIRRQRRLEDLHRRDVLAAEHVARLRHEPAPYSRIIGWGIVTRRIACGPVIGAGPGEQHSGKRERTNINQSGNGAHGKYLYSYKGV